MDWLDVMTLAIILSVVVLNVFFLIWLAALPGKLATQRQHPQASAINALGWLSFITFFATWPLALVWAYTRPANVMIQKNDPENVPL